MRRILGRIKHWGKKDISTLDVRRKYYMDKLDVMIDVSIVIVNYNTEQLILNCIDSILKETKGLSFEIIVVDNASPTPPMKLRKMSSVVQYIQSTVNLGFGRGNNLGAKSAKGKYIFCLNPDTVLINNAIGIFFHYMEEFPKTGVCGGNLFYADLSPAHSFEILPDSITSEIYKLFGVFKKWKGASFNFGNKPQSVAYIVGADLFIRTDIFKKLGGFDEGFFMYFEETYLCYEVKKMGYDIVNIPQAKIVHLEGKSPIFLKEKERIFQISRKLYFTKRYNFVYYMFCNLIYCITCLSRILLFKMLQKESKVEEWKNKFKSLVEFMMAKN